jgi:hypothetical protein
MPTARRELVKDEEQRRRPREQAAPAPDPRAHALLALQRGAGNQAVARVLARKIGFEFEADGWSSWKRTQELSLEERLMPPDQRRLPHTKFEPLKKKDPIHDGTGFTLEADEAKHKDQLGRNKSDIEFVTAPFDETPAGLQALKVTLDEIRDLAEGMVGMREANDTQGSLNWHDEMTQAGLRPRPKVHLSSGDRPLKVKMQSTFGLRLDQVMGFMATFGDAQPGESKSKKRKRADARELMTHRVIGVPMQTAAGVNMGLAASEANRAVDWFIARHKPQGPNHDASVARFGNTDALKGLVAMITLYLKLGDQIGASASYPKAIAALMARTDFAQMFRMLPDLQKITFRNDDALWYELIQNAANVPLNQPVLNGAPWLQHLTVDLWLQHIPLGTDLLTQQGYQLLAAALQPQLDDGEFGEAMADSEMLESMGSMGSKTEGEGDTQAAIFELRAIPDYFPHTEIPRISKALAKYITGLNKGKDTKFKL